MISIASVKAREGDVRLSADRQDLLRVSGSDNYEMFYLLLGSYCSLLSDSPLEDGLKPAGTIKRFFAQLLLDPIKVISTFSNLSEEILHGGTLFGTGTTTGPFIPGMKDTPVFKEYLAWRETGNHQLLQYLLTFLRFAKKMKWVNPELDATSFRGWLSVERRLEDLVLPETIHLRNIVHAILSRDSVASFPHHSGGSTADFGRVLSKKMRNLLPHPRLHRAFFSNLPFKRVVGQDWPHELSTLVDPTLWPSDISGVPLSTDISELRFVPKTIRTSRSICMEPVSFMYFQQFYRRILERKIAAGVCGRWININDQTYNQDGCYFGSVFGCVDTIDLSSASDSVSLELVRKIFPREVLYYLLATRTSKVRVPDGSVVLVNKFAPMGSALCFPTQCIIFCAMTILSYGHHYSSTYGVDLDDIFGSQSACLRFIRKHIRKDRFYDPRSRKYQAPGVYGDDIICDSHTTDILINLLTSYGFSVNTEKSFLSSSAFRESCGKYYWCGFDVTPLSFKPLVKSGLDAKLLPSITSLANLAGDFRYMSLRSYIINRCLRLAGGSKLPIRFSSDRNSSCTFYSTNVRNEHLKSRWNSQLQRDEVRSVSVGYSRRKHRFSNATELGAYVRWWRSASSRRIAPSSDDGRREGDSSPAKLVWVWTPDER